MKVIVSPATYEKEQWVLPAFWLYSDPETGIEEIEEQATEFRQSYGVEARN